MLVALLKQEAIDSMRKQSFQYIVPLVETYSDCTLSAAPRLDSTNINCSTFDNATLASLLEAIINPNLNDQDRYA